MCNSCRNRTEAKLLAWLRANYESVAYQMTYHWCKNAETGRLLPFDYEVSKNIIIELDGLQHFRQVSNWQTPEMRRGRDVYKAGCALKNGKAVIRIQQEEVFRDSIDWKAILKNLIEDAQIGVIYYVDDKGMYEQHDKDLRFSLESGK